MIFTIVYLIVVLLRSLNFNTALWKATILIIWNFIWKLYIFLVETGW
jgi:hypothetical protein